MPTEKQNKLSGDCGVPSFLDLRILLNNKRSVVLDNMMHANFTAEDTAREILSKETIDFFTEGEDFFNYVWDRFGFEVYMAMLGIVNEQLPTYVLANVLDNFILRITRLQGQTHRRQCPFSEQPAVSQQFFLQTYFPQISSISQNSGMGSPNNNNGYRGRNNWSPFYPNYYPYARNNVASYRRRSHLDDIYLPNYEDDDLEERNGFSQQRFRNRRHYWYNNNPSQRPDYRSVNRTLSFVKRSKFSEPNRNDNNETKTNDLPLKDNAAASTSATSCSCAKNCDRKKCEEVKATEVNSSLLTNELQGESKTSISHKHSIFPSKLNDCGNSSPPCHNSDNNLKTEDISANSHSSDLTNIIANDVNYISSVPVSCEEAPDKMEMTEELQIYELLNNFHAKPNSSDKDIVSTTKEKKPSEICESANENHFAALKHIDYDEEIDGFGDFITIDKIDTAKSFLKAHPIVLDDYKVIDMDISPLKRKKECDEEEEMTKRARYDSLCFNINSDKLLNEINKVLKEDKQSFEISKRFRSKSLTLMDTRENSPITRSSSMDSIDKSKVQVSYNFDLKTNLLLLLKQNPTGKEAPSSVNNILKVLKGGDEKLSTVDNLVSLKKDASDGKTQADINIANGGSTQDVKQNYSEEKNVEASIQPEENRKTPGTTDSIKTSHDVQVSPMNSSHMKRDTEINVKVIPSAQSVIKNEPCIKSELEESNDSLSNSKRKSSGSHEEQSKKICLDSIAENMVQPIKASHTNENTENEVAMKKKQSTDDATSLTKPDLKDTNQNNVESVPLSNKTVSKDSYEESLVDIEEELKSLLAEDSLNNQQKKLGAFQKERVENKDQKEETNNTNDGRNSGNKKLFKINSSTDTTCTESSSLSTSNLSQESSNPRKPSEKGMRQGTRKLQPHKQKKKQIKNRSSSNPVQSKPKEKLIREQTFADKKQKYKETHFKNGNCADVATPSMISQSCSNKPLLHESGERQNASKSKTINYYQHFKRIQLLFGSDSESEIEEGSLVNLKTIQNVVDNNYKNCTNRKIYEESNKRDVQTQKQEVAELRTNLKIQLPQSPIESQKSVNLAEYYINKYIKNVPRSKPSHSLNESSKTIEKRRSSFPITNHSPSLIFSEGAGKTPNATINKPKRIEKKRRETLPASLNGRISKKDKPHQVGNDHVQKGNVCVINHKLKDPRKEHYRYKSMEKSEQKSETNSIKNYAVRFDSNKTLNKVNEKYKNGKRNVFCKNSVPKIDKESRKNHVFENKPKNLKETTSKKESCTIEAIINQLQLQSKFSKTDQIKTVASVPKELDASKIHTEIESTLQTGKQEPVHIQLMQCSPLPPDRFPMLQRASSCIQENDCCDKAVALENVDINEKIDVVQQVVDQEDDVIEVKQDIPIIDLTNDSVKKKPYDLSKAEVKDVSHEISYKTNEMITLYRSEETVDSSLDIQPTSESISSSVLRSKQNQGKQCNTVEGFTSSKSQNSDNINDEFSNASSTLYISPLSNNTTQVSSPARFKSNIISDVSKGSKTQNSNKSPSSNFTSPPPPPPTVSQTVKPSEVLIDTRNIDTSTSHARPSVTHNSGGSFVKITNQENLTTQISVDQRQDSFVNPPRRILFNIQNNSQQSSVSASTALAQLQQKVDNLHKSINNSLPIGQNPLLYNMSSDNVPRKNAYGIHSPMRHTEDEGPAPMHEISMQEITSAGIVLLKYLLLYENMKKAQWAYKNELLKIQKNLPAIVRLEIYHFESFSYQKDKKLYKDLIKELKILNLTGRSSNVKSAEVLMENVFQGLHRIVGNLTLWRVYLMLDTLMQPEVSEYMAVPFLKDLFSYVSFVAGKIRSAFPVSTQPENPQIVSPPQDLFTPNQRKMLEWQIKQYTSICSIQKRLMEELQSNISKRLVNSGMGITQDIQQLPNYTSQIKTLIPTASNQQPSVNKVCPNLTVHQNIIIRPVDAIKLNSPSASSNFLMNKDTCAFNDTFKIRLPYTAPYENSLPSTSAPVQEQEEINCQVNTQASVNTQPSPTTPQAAIKLSPATNKCGSADPATVALSLQQVETIIETDSVVIKQEKETPLLTDQEIETIDLTWIKDIDPKQLQTEMEFIAVKKEELPDDEENELELNEEPFAVAPSPADSGIASPPIQVEYDETVFSNRSCICEKVAEYVCGCMMAMYCSMKCQYEDWNSHKDVCHKYKAKNNKPHQ